MKVRKRNVSSSNRRNAFHVRFGFSCWMLVIFVVLGMVNFELWKILSAYDDLRIDKHRIGVSRIAQPKFLQAKDLPGNSKPLSQRGWSAENVARKVGTKRLHTVETSRCDIPYLASEPLYPLNKSGCSIEPSLEMTVEGNLKYIAHCSLKYLRIDPSRISSVAVGGEPLEDVMGQDESDEYLNYNSGAFVVTEPLIHTAQLPYESMYYLTSIVESAVVNNTSANWTESCSTSVMQGATIFIQRYEYANLYHTMTDIWNTWEVYRKVASVPNTSRVVLLDAHPHGALDDVWDTLFGMHRANAMFQETNCFESAYLIPPGYVSRLTHNTQCTDPTYMTEFISFVLEKYNLHNVHRIPGRVSIIDRKPYVAHARSSVHTTDKSREIHNVVEVAGWIQRHEPNVTSVQILVLHNMTFREQIHAIRESEVLIADHGAGLTHLLFMDHATHIIECRSAEPALNYFSNLVRWKTGINYHQLPLVEGTMTPEYFDTQLLPVLSRIYAPQQATS